MKYWWILLLLSKITLAANISGKVIDAETEAPIPYATLLFVDLNSGTSCDENGLFSYSGNFPQNTLVKVSAVGYETIVINSHDLSDQMVIKLSSSHIELEEFVVSTNGELQKNSIVNVEKRTLDELQTIAPNDLVSAISNIPSVYTLSTGNGISKPVIRGLSGMRIVTYLNGLRIENQQWGGDHGLGINPNGIGSVEIIKGPSALLYGVDALGGVLYLSEEAFANQNSTEIKFSSGLESNNLKWSNAMGVKLSKKRISFNFFASHVKASDYQLPNQQFVKNSRFTQQDVKASLGYHHRNWVMTFRYNYVNNLTGIPGHTHDSTVTAESFLSNDQGRKSTIPAQQIQNHFALLENNFYLKKTVIKVKTGFTSNRLQEFDEKVTIPELDMFLNNFTYQVNASHNITDQIQLIAGVQGMIQDIKNNPGAEGEIIPDANISDVGAYGLLKGSLLGWKYQAGLRWDNRTIHTLTTGINEWNRSFEGLNYSAGLNKSIGSFNIRLNAASGFRPPHSSEALINGLHHGTMRYEIGNDQLASEHATQFDVGLEYQSEHFYFMLNPYISTIKNYIYIAPQDSTIDGYPVYAYTQDPKAILQGGDISIHYHPHFAHRLHFEHNTSLILANTSEGQALPLTPPARFNSLLKYQLDTENHLLMIDYIALQHIYYSAQNSIAAFETPTPGYHLVHLGINLKIGKKQPLDLQLGVRNLLNNQYIDHLSRLKPFGIEAPGRNFYFSLKYNIKIKK